MDEIIIYAVISLGAVGGAAAIILYFVAQKFKVIEDPRIDLVEEALPAAKKNTKEHQRSKEGGFQAASWQTLCMYIKTHCPYIKTSQMPWR